MIYRLVLFGFVWIVCPVAILAGSILSWKFLFGLLAFNVLAFALSRRARMRMKAAGISFIFDIKGQVRFDDEALRELICRRFPDRFYESEQFPCASVVEDNAGTIRDEVSAYLDESRASLGSAYDNPAMQIGEFWKARSILAWGLTTRDILPKTRAIMEEIGAINCNVSVLEPNSEIDLHNGESNGYLRFHLGLKIPASLPDCGFEVAGERRPWKEGKLLAFNDLHRHGAFNHSDQERFILIFDVIHPHFVEYKADVCRRLLVFYSMLALRAAYFSTLGSLAKSKPLFWLSIAAEVCMFGLFLGIFDLLFRLELRRPPFWLRKLEGTGFYF